MRPTIAVFIASEYMIIGVLLALWALVTAFVYPVVKGIGYLLFHAKLRRNRVRAVASICTASSRVVLPAPFAPAIR